jgi:hypothetical protein
MKKTFITKLGKFAATASLFLFSGVIIFTLQTAAGWTNPSANPPGAPGALYYSNGNVGIGTNNPARTLSVNGVISSMGNLIKDVATPVDGTDAVNKDYVLAATSDSSALTGPIIIYGYGSRGGLIPPDPGTGVPACPNGYTDMLYSNTWDLLTGMQTGPVVAGGYGPFGTIWSYGSGWNDNNGNNTSDMVDDPLVNDPDARLAGATALSYSICSTINNHIANFSGASSVGTNPVGMPIPLQMVPACASAGGFVSCNTCRICGKYTPPVTP